MIDLQFAQKDWIWKVFIKNKQVISFIILDRSLENLQL